MGIPRRSLIAQAVVAVLLVLPAAASPVAAEESLPDEITGIVDEQEYAAVVAALPDARALVSDLAQAQTAASRAAAAALTYRQASTSVKAAARAAHRLALSGEMSQIRTSVIPLIREAMETVENAQQLLASAEHLSEVARDSADAAHAQAALVRADAEAIAADPTSGRASETAAFDALVVAGASAAASDDLRDRAAAALAELRAQRDRAGSAVASMGDFLGSTRNLIENWQDKEARRKLSGWFLSNANRAWMDASSFAETSDGAVTAWSGIRR